MNMIRNLCGWFHQRRGEFFLEFICIFFAAFLALWLSDCQSVRRDRDAAEKRLEALASESIYNFNNALHLRDMETGSNWGTVRFEAIDVSVAKVCLQDERISEILSPAELSAVMRYVVNGESLRRAAESYVENTLQPRSASSNTGQILHDLQRGIAAQFAADSYYLGEVLTRHLDISKYNSARFTADMARMQARKTALIKEIEEDKLRPLGP